MSRQCGACGLGVQSAQDAASHPCEDAAIRAWGATYGAVSAPVEGEGDAGVDAPARAPMSEGVLDEEALTRGRGMRRWFGRGGMPSTPGGVVPGA